MGLNPAFFGFPAERACTGDGERANERVGERAGEERGGERAGEGAAGSTCSRVADSECGTDGGGICVAAFLGA